jgi:hypothetical protein
MAEKSTSLYGPRGTDFAGVVTSSGSMDSDVSKQVERQKEGSRKIARSRIPGRRRRARRSKSR